MPCLLPKDATFCRTHSTSTARDLKLLQSTHLRQRLSFQLDNTTHSSSFAVCVVFHTAPLHCCCEARQRLLPPLLGEAIEDTHVFGNVLPLSQDIFQQTP